MEDWQPFGMNVEDCEAYVIKHIGGHIGYLPDRKDISHAVVL